MEPIDRSTAIPVTEQNRNNVHQYSSPVVENHNGQYVMVNRPFAESGSASDMMKGYWDPGSSTSQDFEFLGRQGAAGEEIAKRRAEAEAALNRGPTTLNVNHMAGARAQQLGLAGVLAGAANGQGPSASGFQFQNGMNNLNAGAAVGRAGVSNQGSAMMNAIRGQAGGGAQLAGQAAGTLSSEMGAAQQERLAMLGGMRKADDKWAATEAGLDLAGRRRNMNDFIARQGESVDIGKMQMDAQNQKLTGMMGAHGIGVNEQFTTDEANRAEQANATNRNLGLAQAAGSVAAAGIGAGFGAGAAKKVLG